MVFESNVGFEKRFEVVERLSWPAVELSMFVAEAYWLLVLLPTPPDQSVCSQVLIADTGRMRSVNVKSIATVNSAARIRFFE